MLAVLFFSSLGSTSYAATFNENFSGPPPSSWQSYGETLHAWNPTNQALNVTWDSSHSNSFFWRGFDTILARSDDFSFSFDLQLSDIAVGVTSNKSLTFELAVGFLNYANATNSAVLRGTGVNSQHGARNTCEFDYFPDSGFGATISPTIISSNNQFTTQFAFPLELDPGALFHVAMNYAGASYTLSTSVSRNGTAFGTVPNAVLGSSRDFRLDRFAIINWSSVGADGSLLAHGLIDNVTFTVPPPAVQNFSGTLTNGIWQGWFLSNTNFLYTLESSPDFQLWTAVSPTTNGSGAWVTLSDTNPPAATTLYRVRAERP